jgi:dynactin 1
MSGVAEQLEMLSLDKEMAEERAEILQQELDQAKERIDELDIDLNLAKETYDGLTKNVTPGGSCYFLCVVQMSCFHTYRCD